MTNLTPFTDNHVCLKCGGLDIGIQYSRMRYHLSRWDLSSPYTVPVHPHLVCVCRTCGHEWCMRTKDDPVQDSRCDQCGAVIQDQDQDSQ